MKRGFAQVIVAPHAGFTAGDFTTGGNMIPAIGAVINGVEEEALVIRGHAEISVGQQGAHRREAGLPIAFAGGGIGAEVATEAQQTLDANSGGGTVDRLEIIKGIRGTRAPIAESAELGRAAVPIGDPIEGGIGDVPIAGGLRGFEH